MNRRQLLQAITATCSAGGLAHAGDFAVYGGERKPMLAVIHCPRPLPAAAVESMRKCWDGLLKMSPELPPCVVLDGGIRLEMVDAVPPELRS
jgi:hypothetical protein